MEFKDQSTGVANVSGNLEINYNNFPINKLSSAVTELILVLSDNTENEKISSDYDFNTYEINQKLDENNVIKHRQAIEEYGEFGGLIDSSYEALEEAKPTSKEKILRHIKNQYMDALGNILKKNNSTDKEKRSELIKQHSDSIIDDVISKLFEEVSNSSNLKKLQSEDVMHGIRCIVFHAFVECQILEKPTK